MAARILPAPTEVTRPRFGRAEAWVESPLQLLSAIEAHGAGLLGTSTRIHPRGGGTGLDATLRTLISSAPAGIEFARHSLALPSPAVPEIDRWVTGDAYSGKFQQALLGRLAVREVVVIDDGLVTRSLLRTLCANEPTPLVRQRSAANPARSALGLAAWYRMRALARTGRLLVFTALPVEAGLEARFRELGGHLERHRFEWLGTQPVAEHFHQRTLVVGSALAADGLIDPGPYLHWVNGLCADGPLAYFPHRRERPGFLSELARNPLITLHAHTIPVEMRLRGLRTGQTVRALPSTVLPSLRLLLRPNGVRVEGRAVPDHWWTDEAAPGLREHLSTSLQEEGP
ncbi:hypothetical protein [Paeniglutamicibacter cryotolerans]|uniref:Uncharacterized protein n=1 Tax=Paeniglutamicibacter cryotolerans TaxID=670079 RepID=A0A839QH25_9MICC|nr:hypothetical protein [Paeniglutamicibacter cryotolerans]MBB2994903.1 hypothetical protein [Paeniglutamicibacter cryotolerans]